MPMEEKSKSVVESSSEDQVGVTARWPFEVTKQDYDDWNMPGWSGEEVFGYMKKVNFLS